MLNSYNRRFPIALVYILFGVPFIGMGLIDSFMNSYFFFYYEAVIGIPIFIVILMFSGVRIIMLLLQPFLGFLSDRDYGFTRKLGRRFPWILISGLITAIMCVVLFTLPTYFPSTPGALIITNYLIFSISSTIFTISLFAALLTRFRNTKERLLIATISETFRGIAILISAFLVPFLINYGIPGTFQFTAIVIAVAFIVYLMIGIVGIMEEREVIDTYFSPNHESKEWFLKDYFKRYSTLKKKNFWLLIIQWIIIAIFNNMFITTLYYYGYFVLNVSSSVLSIFYLGYNIFFVLGISGGFLLSWFLGHLKTYIIAGFLLSIGLILFTFTNGIGFTIILMNAVGFVYGLNTVSMIPLMGDTFDEFSLTTRMRSDGFAYGTLLMFGSLGTFISTFLISFTQSITGFIPGAPTQPLSALWGIKMLFTLIPGILILIGILIFTFTYDLKPERSETIQMKLNELQI